MHQEQIRSLVESIRRAVAERDRIRIEVHGDCIEGVVPGDVVESTAEPVEIGDLVLYYSEQPWRLYVHRVIEWNEDAGTMVTKGDALDEPDPEMPVDPYLLANVQPVELPEPPSDPSYDPDEPLTRVDAAFYESTEEGAVGFHAERGSIYTLSFSGVRLLERLDDRPPAALYEEVPLERDSIDRFVESALDRGLLEPASR